jgi:hypothetical protein
MRQVTDESSMKHSELLRILKEQGVIHQEQKGFSQLVRGIENDCRIVCAERKEADGFHGVSFWLYGDESDWFLGLWSGIFFRITDPGAIGSLIHDLFSGQWIPLNRAPGGLPDELVRQYRLMPIEEEESHDNPPP